MAASSMISLGLGSPASIGKMLTFGLSLAGTTPPAPGSGFVYPTGYIQFALQPLDEFQFENINDVLTKVPIVCEYGILGNTPSDRVASTGRLTFALDDSAQNEGGVLGWYSLLHVNRRTAGPVANSDFRLNFPVVFALTCPEVDAGLPFFKFHGRLDSAPTDPGVYSERVTYCTAVDLMADWATTTEPDLDVQIDQPSHQIVTNILDALDPSLQPLGRDIEEGIETFPYALDGAAGQRLSIRERLNQVILSEYGKGFIRGDSIHGATFCFFNRHHNPRDPRILFTLDNDMAIDGGLILDQTRQHVYRSVKVVVHPTNEVDEASETVLYSSAGAKIYISPGVNVVTLFGPYRDPNSSEPIGGTDIQALVAYTDYTFNALQTGLGDDLTASLTASAATTGSGVVWTLENTSTQGGWVTALQIRGKPIKRNALPIERTVSGSYGSQVLTVDMPYQSNTSVASGIATHLTDVLSTPSARVRAVRFLANRSVLHMAAALKREPGDRVMISETVTGLSDTEVVINSVRLELEEGRMLWCTWGLDAISASHYFLLGVDSFDNLGQTTVLGY